MAKVTRYTLGSQDDDGDMVLFSDYEKLKKYYEALIKTSGELAYSLGIINGMLDSDAGDRIKVKAIKDYLSENLPKILYGIGEGNLKSPN